MTIRPVMLLLFLVIACRFAFGDTLILKNGRKLEGRYLSSTDNSVVFESWPQALHLFDLADQRNSVPLRSKPAIIAANAVYRPARKTAARPVLRSSD